MSTAQFLLNCLKLIPALVQCQIITGSICNIPSQAGGYKDTVQVCTYSHAPCPDPWPMAKASPSPLPDPLVVK